MNTKWEEQFDEKFFDDWPEVLYGDIKTFIKDQITKAQQEIAEQILQDIPKKWNISFMQRVDLSDLKDQLRFKYIN